MTQVGKQRGKSARVLISEFEKMPPGGIWLPSDWTRAIHAIRVLERKILILEAEVRDARHQASFYAAWKDDLENTLRALKKRRMSRKEKGAK